jgi:hypothetical protein
MQPVLTINRIKKLYREYRTTLGATGEGLLNADREDEIIPGSDLANLWGKSFYLSV